MNQFLKRMKCIEGLDSLYVIVSTLPNSTGGKWGFFHRVSDNTEVGQWTDTNFRSRPYGIATTGEREEMSRFVNNRRANAAIKRSN